MLLFAAMNLERLRSGEPFPADGPAAAAFCRANEAALRETIATRTTQTNEVNRCSYLLPCFATAAAGGPPLALIEIGASAGLTLNFDRYAYDYGGGLVAGDPASPARLACELRGGSPPVAVPEVVSRIGVDLAPRPDDEWLRACVFADQPERLARLEAALGIAREHPVEIVRGDALEVLPELIAAAPDGARVVVYHTAVGLYLSEDESARLAALTTSVTYVTAEAEGDPHMELRVAGDHVGDAQPHGAWLDWKDAR
jgi:hypothetical protein